MLLIMLKGSYTFSANLPAPLVVEDEHRCVIFALKCCILQIEFLTCVCVRIDDEKKKLKIDSDPWNARVTIQQLLYPSTAAEIYLLSMLLNQNQNDRILWSSVSCSFS